MNHERRSRGKDGRYYDEDTDSDDYEISASSGSSSQYRSWAKKKARILEAEKAKLIAQWKAEVMAEEAALRRKREESRWYNRLRRWCRRQSSRVAMRTSKLMTAVGAFISNMPLTINAVALAIVTLGVVWFKFAEENLDTCMPVHFHSAQCRLVRIGDRRSFCVGGRIVLHLSFLLLTSKHVLLFPSFSLIASLNSQAAFTAIQAPLCIM